MTAQQFKSETGHSGDATGCPFYDASRRACAAALLVYQPDCSHRALYCASDDHDDCVMFLAKALRSSAPGGQARDVIAFGEK